MNNTNNFNWNDFISYDPTSSTFFRYKAQIGPKTPQGSVAGRTRASKGVEVSITFTGSELASALYRSFGTQRISGARLAWTLHYGPIPEGKWVVCLDGNLQNLELDNLTLMTQSQRRLYSSLIKDCKGIEFRGKQWTARIRQKKGPDRHYSIHDTEVEAKKAHRLAVLRLLRGVI